MGILDFLMGSGTGSGSPDNNTGPHQMGYFDRIRAYNNPAGYAAEERAWNQQNTYNMLLKQGASPEMALGMATNPQAFGMGGQYYFPQEPKLHTINDSYGNTQFYTERAGPGGNLTLSEQQVLPASGTGTGAGSSSSLAPGVRNVDSSLKGDEYLAQFSDEVKQAVKALGEGNMTPTSNPRLKGFESLARRVATKYYQDIGKPMSEADFMAKRKMRTDLASSGPNSAGGILANGMSALSHLGDLGDALADVGNMSGGDYPGGNMIARAGNYLQNNPALRTQSKANAISSTRSPLLKYGQESTKFYAGTGGSREERTKPQNIIDVENNTGGEMASFLGAEKKLMLDRFAEKEAQVRSQLGDEFADELVKKGILPGANDPHIKRIDAAIARLKGEKVGTEGVGSNPGGGIKLEIRYDAKGNAFVRGPNGQPVPYKP